MAEPAVIAPGAGEVIGDAPDRRVEILADHDALHATWSRFGPRRDGADPHVHRDHTDLFYVLEGELTVALGPGRDEVTLPAGTLAAIPPLVVHGFRNAADAEVRYLNFHAPGQGFAAYMRGLRDGRPVDFDQWPPPADGGRPASDAIVASPGAVVLDDLSVAEVVLGHGDPDAPPEAGRGGDRWIYVLDGDLALGGNGADGRAAAGSWVHVPPGLAVTLDASGAGPVRCLTLSAPGA